jgi:non-heme Fe2+,alpha-ketoglutarate-dependent halogenase
MSMPERFPLSAFDDNGFAGPFRLYEPEHAERLLQSIRLKNPDRRKALHDNEVNYDRHFDISELSRHIGHEAIVDRLVPLIGPDILCWRTEFFPKFPGANGTEWHQVEVYQYSTGVPQLARTLPPNGRPMELTVWTAFTHCTTANGCLKFLPGSHRRLYFDESRPPRTGRAETYASIEASTDFFGYDFNDFKVDPDWRPDESEAVAMEMEPGECVIFTARCVHGSFPNTTRRSLRFGISSRYVPTHVRVYPDQPRFHAHGGDFDLADFGCVLVRGHDGFGHNRLRETNNLGEPFAYRDQATSSS